MGFKEKIKTYCHELDHKDEKFYTQWKPEFYTDDEIIKYWFLDTKICPRCNKHVCNFHFAKKRGICISHLSIGEIFKL